MNQPDLIVDIPRGNLPWQMMSVVGWADNHEGWRVHLLLLIGLRHSVEQAKQFVSNVSDTPGGYHHLFVRSSLFVHSSY
jgi:hypothetical protein